MSQIFKDKTLFTFCSQLLIVFWIITFVSFSLAEESYLLKEFDLSIEGFEVFRLQQFEGRNYYWDAPIDVESLEEIAASIGESCQIHEGLVWVARNPDASVEDLLSLISSFNVTMFIKHGGLKSFAPSFLFYPFISADHELVGQWKYIETATEPTTKYARLEMCLIY